MGTRSCSTTFITCGASTSLTTRRSAMISWTTRLLQRGFQKWKIIWNGWQWPEISSPRLGLMDANNAWYLQSGPMRRRLIKTSLNQSTICVTIQSQSQVTYVCVFMNFGHDKTKILTYLIYYIILD